MLNNEALPVGDANIGITCVVCHDPHQKTAHGAQLRNPVASTNDYFLSTSDVFTNKYDASINVCAQCHNHRGALWTSSSRPPHHSPQYNFLLGTVGELLGGPSTGDPAAHAFLEKQCVTCHMQTEAPPDESHPGVAGHKFKVETFDTCLNCHPFPEELVDFTDSVVSSRIQQVKSSLDQWGTTKSPEPLRTKYGARAWEYTNPGELSGAGPAPTSNEQNLVPEAIKKARFNLYLVQYDGSGGVHNPLYALKLLDTADAWVRLELNK
jgi:formate-dependent nitrite reductase cytochrome c552 subunit